jgi:hypothetical protein
MVNQLAMAPWCSSVYGTEDRGFESLQGVRFYEGCSLYLNLRCYCVYLNETNVK